jgi:hypothetical protein
MLRARLMTAKTARPPPSLLARSLGLVLSCLACGASAEPFLGQFELKTLESERGAFELQSQNAWAFDQPRRRIADVDGELLMDENALFKSRHALELEIGLTSSLKIRVGVEFENSRLEEPTLAAKADDFDGLELEEIGAEIVAVLVPREGDGTGLGFVVEIEGPIDQDGANHLIAGPIVEHQAGAWFFAAVPMVVRAFGNDTEDAKWDFAYALQAARRLSDRWTIALEGYGTIERLGGSGRPSPANEYFGDVAQHRVGPFVYYACPFGLLTNGATRDDDTPTLTIGFGVLEGLTSETPEHTIKLSIELDF